MSAEILGSIVEFSIGLAGFTGIVLVAGYFQNLTPQLAELRFANLLISGFAPGFFGLVSLALVEFGVGGEAVITASSALLLVFLVVWLVLATVRTPSEGRAPLLSATMWGGASINILMQILGLFLLDQFRAGFYVAGLIVLLLQGAIVFSYTALRSVRERYRDA